MLGKIKRLWQTIFSKSGGNALLVIFPYRYRGTWVFDDAKRGLDAEPFVMGIPEMIDKMVVGIPNAKQGFRLTFSTQEFPGYHTKLDWVRPEMGGNWYKSSVDNTEGWLCPALFKFFKKAPMTLYGVAEQLRAEDLESYKL